MSEENQNAAEIQDGYYDAVVRDADIIEDRYDASRGYEVQIEIGVFNADKSPLCKAEVYLELSARQGVGNNANKTSYQISLEKLQKLGFEGGDDLSRIKEIVGKPCRVSYATKDSKGIPFKYGPRWSLTFSRPVKKVDPKAAMAGLKALMAGVSGTPPPPPGASSFNAVGGSAVVAPPPPGDPFANL